MTALLDISGQVIGAMDARYSLPIRKGAVRRITRDESLVDGDKEELIDSTQARRILKAFHGSKEDTLTLIDMMIHDEMLDEMEGSNLKDALNSEQEQEQAPEATQAADARRDYDKAFPNAGRLK